MLSIYNAEKIIKKRELLNQAHLKEIGALSHKGNQLLILIDLFQKEKR
jgi:hypothetical protein